MNVLYIVYQLYKLGILSIFNYPPFVRVPSYPFSLSMKCFLLWFTEYICPFMNWSIRLSLTFVFIGLFTFLCITGYDHFYTTSKSPRKD